MIKTSANLTRFAIVLSAALLSACSNTGKIEASNIDSNIEGITDAELSATYWLESTDDVNNTILTPQQITKLNQAQLSQDTYLFDPLSYPESLPKQQVLRLIQAISKPSKYDRFYPNGQQLSAADYQPYLDEMAVNQIKAQQTVQFAVAAKRSALRMLPTLDRVLNSGMDFDIDRFQESAVFPGEALAVLHTSKTGKWAFVQNYHYRAWVQTKDIALASKADVTALTKDPNFLLVTGAKVLTNFNPYDNSTSEVQLDMGVKLPLISPAEFKAYELDRQNPYASHIVALPTRDEDGKLIIKPTLIGKNADVNKGYIAFTKANVIKQGFKFLGERYGWGHDFNGRDCTGFVGEIYKTFGILMPRNSSQQGKALYGSNTRFEKNAKITDKLSAFGKMEVGDLIYLPGHVAMYLGESQGQPFIIHDVHGLSYENSNSQQVKGVLNGVSVTPLLPFKGYLKGIYNIKKVR